MTEPVAWRVEDVSETLGWRYSTLKPITKGYEPLYTAEQLHLRVKMTQAEFDEFKKLLSVGISTIYEALDVIDSDRGETNEFEQLYNRLFTNGVNEQVKQQNEFAKLWDSLLTYSAEEMIEIVPDMKWFVRTKEFDDEWYKVLEDIRLDYYEYGNVANDEETAEYGHPFDTKEEAEKWTNPLTEAVQLPVEDE